MKNLFFQIEITKLFQNDYLFQITPPSDGLYRYLTIFFSLLILAAIVLTSYYKKSKFKAHRNVKSKLFSNFLTTGIIGLFLIFCRFEQLPYLGSRFLMLILFLVFIIWVLLILQYWILVAPKEIKKERKKENFTKYLPRKKKSSGT